MFISLKIIFETSKNSSYNFYLLGTRLTQNVGRDQFRISYIIIQCWGCPLIKANSSDKIMHFYYAFY